MTVIAEYEQYDATGLAKLVSEREVSPSDLLETALDRIERRNPTINAIASLFADKARASIAAGLPDGPFRGVPFLLKDLGADYAGTPLMAGSRLMSRNVSSLTSTLVERYLAAGLVIVGKATTAEFGLAGTVETELHGPTRNPWDTTRSTGGSSGGSAAAVASGMVPAAHAGDGGGSIRIPAAWCGLVGLKPTRGRTPAGPVAGEGWAGLTASHVLTRSVRDCAGFLDATHGPAPGDPYAAPPPMRPYGDELAADPGSLRIGLCHAPLDIVPDAEAVAIADRAGRLCEELGHNVEPVQIPFEAARARATLRLITSVNMANVLDQRAQALHGRDARMSDVEAATWEMAQAGAAVSGARYAAAIGEMHAFGRTMSRLFDRFDILLTPTVACAARPIGTLIRDDGVDALHARLMSCFPFTQIYNQTGQPAISLPLFRIAAGLPLGVQFAADLGREDLLLRLAAQLEREAPWPQPDFAKLEIR